MFRYACGLTKDVADRRAKKWKALSSYLVKIFVKRLFKLSYTPLYMFFSSSRSPLTSKNMVKTNIFFVRTIKSSFIYKLFYDRSFYNVLRDRRLRVFLTLSTVQG